MVGVWWGVSVVSGVGGGPGDADGRVERGLGRRSEGSDGGFGRVGGWVGLGVRGAGRRGVFFSEGTPGGPGGAGSGRRMVYGMAGAGDAPPERSDTCRSGSQAHLFAIAADRPHEPLQAQIAQRIRARLLPNLSRPCSWRR